jgi:hypothetical protein
MASIPPPGYIHASSSVGPNNMGQIEVCRDDKDSLERGIKGVEKKRDIYNSINNHSLHPGSSEVVACFTLSQGKEAKKIHTPLSPSSKEKKFSPCNYRFGIVINF